MAILDEYYQLGTIIKPHALRGQMVAYLDVDDLSVYRKLKTVWLASATATAPNQLQAYTVERLQPQTDKRALLTLKGIGRIEEAEPLRNAVLYLPLTELPTLEEDQFYFHDVIGYTVIDATLGTLGTVEAFYELPQQDVMAMRYKDQEVLIPVVDELVSHADKQAQELHVVLPEGLLDIYLS